MKNSMSVSESQFDASLSLSALGLSLLIWGAMFLLTAAIFWLFVMDSWSQERKDRGWKKFVLFCKVYTIVAILMIASPILFEEVTILLTIPLYFVLRWVWNLE